MGLSIYLADRPRPGREGEYARLVGERARLQGDLSPGCLAKLLRLDRTARAERRRARLRQEIREIEAKLRVLLIDPGETIGAPRIGIDHAATDWFRDGEYARRHADALKSDPQRSAQYVAIWKRPFEEVVADRRGEYVHELAQDAEAKASGDLHLETGTELGLLCPSWVPDEFWREQPSEPEPDGGGGCVIRGDVVLRIADELERMTVEHLGSTIPELHGADLRRIREASRGGETGDLSEAADLFHAVDWIRFWARKGFSFGIG